VNPILTKLFGDGVSSLGDVFTKIVGAFKLSPEQKAALDAAAEANKEKLAEMDRDIQVKAMEYEASAIQAASANIQAEAKSGDKFTSRARPMFMYIVEAILAFNYIGIPIAKLLGSTVSPIELPSNLLALFGVCITGYTVFRSLDKFMGLPGDSQVQLGSLKIGNKQQ